MSQSNDIISHLQSVGPLTSLQALVLFGCFRLAARINELQREGYPVESKMIHLPSGKRVAQYSWTGR